MKLLNLIRTGVLLTCISPLAQAATITSMTINTATLEGDLIPGAMVSFTPGPSTNLVSGPIDPVLFSNSPDLSVSITSAIIGTVDAGSNSIMLDLDPWILTDNRIGGVSQNLGKSVKGSWDGNDFSVTWSRKIDTPLVPLSLEQSQWITWRLTGTAQIGGITPSPVPLPAAFWLLASGILTLTAFKRVNKIVT